jgi:signal transduction histidine kinase
VVIVRDITLDKEIDRMKTEFTSTVAHELRTPMTSVIGFTRLIERTFNRRILPELPDDPRTVKAADKVIRNLGIVIEEGERLTSLITNMLDLAKIESGRMDWTMSLLNPGQLVERACHACAGLFTSRDVVLQESEAEEVGPIFGDADWLQQVLVNLISNAAKFTTSGTVTVGVRVELGDVVFSVTDTGTGIPQSHLTRVFDKFAQVGTQKGTGLGLPICREIVSAHGGEIWCESVMGEGSTFAFKVPTHSKTLGL